MRVLLTFLALCFVVVANANDSKKLIPYTGQANDEVALSRVDVVTTYKQVPYDATCYRDVPRTVQKCGNKTYYRRVCRDIPGRNVCRTVSNSVCRNVTKTRQQCSTGPSKQVCSTSPTRQVCRDVNGRRVCSTVGGKRTCKSVPGQRTCRNVSYTDRVCTPVSKRVCTWKPGYRDCNDEPYSKYVCWDTTVYDSVPYACTKYRDVPQYHDVKQEATVLVSFRGKTSKSFDLDVSLLKNGSVQLDANRVATSDIIVLESINSSTEAGKKVVRAVVGIIPASKVVVDQSIQIASATIQKKMKVVTVKLNKEILDHKTLDLSMKLTKKNGRKLVVSADLKSEAQIQGKTIKVNLASKVSKLKGKNTITVTLKRRFDKKIISKNPVQLSNVMEIKDIKAKNSK